MTLVSDGSAVRELVERSVRQRCHDRVRMLIVEVIRNLVAVRGLASTYYEKQLALEGARAALRDSNYKLQIEIVVS